MCGAAVSNQQPSDSSEWEKNHLNVTTFEKDVTTKGIGPVTKYSRSGKVRNLNESMRFLIYLGLVRMC